jgi:hypothetical protein
VFILPRGDAGRTPFLHQFDATVSYEIPFGDDGTKLAFNATVFNIFNSQEAILVDNEYTQDVMDSAAPGTSLTELRNANGEPVNVNPTFGEARLRQSPLSVRVGAVFTF